MMSLKHDGRDREEKMDQDSHLSTESSNYCSQPIHRSCLVDSGFSALDKSELPRSQRGEWSF